MDGRVLYQWNISLNISTRSVVVITFLVICNNNRDLVISRFDSGNIVEKQGEQKEKSTTYISYILTWAQINRLMQDCVISKELDIAFLQ